MTRLWWLRHGPTHEKRLTGWREVAADLSDHDALLRLDAYLPAGAPVVSSDLGRALATARALPGSRPLLPADPMLREIDFGLWDGMEWDRIADGWPELSRAFWDDPGEIAAPRGESWNQAAARVSAAADRLVAERAGGDVIVVAHYGAILTQYARAAGLSPRAALAQRIEPLSVTCLAFADASWQVVTVNHCP